MKLQPLTLLVPSLLSVYRFEENSKVELQPHVDLSHHALLPLMQEDAPHKMKFYHYPNWPHDGLPRNTEDFFKLIGNVLKSQRMYGGRPAHLGS